MLILAVIVGAMLALFSYDLGRNNKPALPKFSNPFQRAKPAANGDQEPKRATIDRGM